MTIFQLTEKEKKEYNQFVADSATGSFLQSWEWGEWQEKLGREVLRFFILDESGQTVGSVQFIKMPLPMGRFYLYAPYGPVGDEGEYKDLATELKKKFPGAIFIRIEPKNLALGGKLLALSKTKNIQPGKTLLINLSQSEAELLVGMHHKTRYNIRVAKKHQVEIQDEFSLQIGSGFFVREAIELLVQTAERQGYKGFGTKYYSQMVDFFAVHNRGEVKLHIYKAVFENKLLAAAIMIDFGKVRTFLFGGSSSEHKNVMAPYLMHFQAMLDAKNQGLDYYDFWGVETASGETPGFVKFKLGFAPVEGIESPNGKILEYGGAYDLIVSNFQYQLYKFLRGVNSLTKKISH